MSTNFEKLRWKLYSQKKSIMFAYGIVNGLIKIYDMEFIERLRKISVGGIPASIVLLTEGLVQGYCYDRSWLVTMGFKDDDEFEIIYAAQRDLAWNPEYIDEVKDATEDEKRIHAEHCYAVRTDEKGIKWVYDTSLGLVFEKNFYNKIEHPIIRHKNDKKNIINYIEYQEVKNASFERDKYGLTLIIPFLRVAKATQPFYQQLLESEIKLFLETIDYDGICEEIDADMKSKGFNKGLIFK